MIRVPYADDAASAAPRLHADDEPSMLIVLEFPPRKVIFTYFRVV